MAGSTYRLPRLDERDGDPAEACMHVIHTRTELPLAVTVAPLTRSVVKWQEVRKTDVRYARNAIDR
jgi:hypothetical protein